MNTENNNNNLTKLSNLEKKDADIYRPDYLNYPVLGKNSFKIGRVTDLLVDDEEARVRYLDIEVEGEESNHMLLPVGLAHLDKEQKYVYTDDITKNELDKMPRYSGDNVTRDYENQLRSSLTFSKQLSPEEMESDFYNNHHFNEHSLFGIRNSRRSQYIRKGDNEKMNWDRGLGRD
jgi:hypothetical protein